jgi:hypothetical protein
MSGQSAKRYGIEITDNLELESRIRRIEVALDQKANANQDADSTARGSGSVPQVTGLRVIGSTPGAVTVGWSASPIPDFRRYDLNFATSLAFVDDLQEYTEATTQYVFSTASSTGGGGGTTWYARVRAVSTSGQHGIWSATLNLTTGQAQTADLGTGSVTSAVISTVAADAIQASAVVFAPTSTIASTTVQTAISEAVSDLTTLINALPFTVSFTSAAQTLVDDSSVTVAHGLGVVPKMVWLTLVNITAELGYVTGDVVGPFGGIISLNPSFATTRVVHCWVDSTNVYLLNDAGTIIIIKGGGTQTAITNANWGCVVRAYA